MQDLTKIDKPFGLLYEDTQMALRMHGGPYQLFSYTGWIDCNVTYWNNETTYRVKPQKLTKPSIDWSHVHADYNWLTTDENGRTYLSKNKPYRDSGIWITTDGYSSVGVHVSFVPGTCDWADSLVQRPGTE